jgi:hypothetical protein
LSRREDEAARLKLEIERGEGSGSGGRKEGGEGRGGGEYAVGKGTKPFLLGDDRREEPEFEAEREALADRLGDRTRLSTEVEGVGVELGTGELVREEDEAGLDAK